MMNMVCQWLEYQWHYRWTLVSLWSENKWHGRVIDLNLSTTWAVNKLGLVLGRQVFHDHAISLLLAFSCAVCDQRSHKPHLTTSTNQSILWRHWLKIPWSSYHLSRSCYQNIPMYVLMLMKFLNKSRSCCRDRNGRTKQTELTNVVQLRVWNTKMDYKEDKQERKRRLKLSDGQFLHVLHPHFLLQHLMSFVLPEFSDAPKLVIFNKWHTSHMCKIVH